MSGGAAHAKSTRACPGPLTVCLPRSVGLFPEDDIPEKAYRKLLEGRRERKAKKRLPKSRLQSKTGRTPARGRGGGFRSGCHGEHACTVSPKLACTRAPYFLPASGLSDCPGPLAIFLPPACSFSLGGCFRSFSTFGLCAPGGF